MVISIDKTTVEIRKALSDIFRMLRRSKNCFGKYASMCLELQSCFLGHVTMEVKGYSIVEVMGYKSWGGCGSLAVKAFCSAKGQHLVITRFERMIKLRITRERKGIRSFWLNQSIGRV